MAFIILRIGLFAIFLSAGYLLGGKYDSQIIGAAWGAAIGAFALLTEAVSRRFPWYCYWRRIRHVNGLVLANLLLFLKGCYSGFCDNSICCKCIIRLQVCLWIEAAGLTISGILRLFKGQGFEENLKLLDTSVIIDGRIADVCEAGFIEGIFILPQFILQELQYVADSRIHLKGQGQERPGCSA